MKNTFKQRNNFLKNYCIIKILSTLLFLSFISGFAYNQIEKVLAVENTEEEEKGRLLCGKEIPVGEAMEKSGELLEKIIGEMEEIKKNSLYLIESQKEMEELAKKCNLDNCIPFCDKVPVFDGYECIPQPCAGDPCPDKEKIKELFTKITDLNEKIQDSKNEMHEFIYGKVEPICVKENEDIRTLGEKAQCLLNLDPRITAQKAIERKLDLSRDEFDKCYISPADLEKVFKGEKEGKILFNCKIVMNQDLPRETKTIKEGVPVCTSFHNWFCCY